LSDTGILKTLPARELKAGYSEIVKYALLGDYRFFTWLEKNGEKVLSCEPNAIAKAIALSCTTKARIVAEDEKETGAPSSA
jgi:3-dehydroquinate synthase